MPPDGLTALKRYRVADRSGDVDAGTTLWVGIARQPPSCFPVDRGRSQGGFRVRRDRQRADRPENLGVVLPEGHLMINGTIDRPTS